MLNTFWKFGLVTGALCFAMSMWVVAAEDGDIDPQPVEEKICVDPPAAVADAKCTTNYGPPGTGGCNAGWSPLTSVSCSNQVTTYGDAGCTGTPGRCIPPVFDATQKGSVTEPATPSLTAGKCYVASTTACECKLTGAQSITWGRKRC